MTKYHIKTILATARERPTNGYEIGQLLYDSLEERMYRLKSRNPHVWQSIESSLFMKIGKCEFHGATSVKGEGIMADLQTLGTFGRGVDANGVNNSASSGTAAIINCGFAILNPLSSDFTGFTRTDFLPYYQIKGFVPAVTSVGSNADTRFYSGYIKNATGPTIGDNPLPQSEGGIVVGFGANDTTWQCWHGDGTNTITKDPLSSIPVPTSITRYHIEMIFTTATNIIINIRNSSNALLQSLTINTNILASGKSMNWIHVIQNANQTNKAIHAHKADMRVIQ